MHKLLAQIQYHTSLSKVVMIEFNALKDEHLSNSS